MTLQRRGWWPGVNSSMVSACVHSTFSGLKQQVAAVFHSFGPIIKIKKYVRACTGLQVCVEAKESTSHILQEPPIRVSHWPEAFG